MQMYKANTDTFDIDRTEVFVSKDGKNIYIELWGKGNGHGPGNGYIKLSKDEFDHICALTKKPIKQGTEEFKNRFDDSDDDWAFT